MSPLEQITKYVAFLAVGSVLLMGITADSFELYGAPHIGTAYAFDMDDDDDGCGDDDDDGSTSDDDNDGIHSDTNDDGDVGSQTGGDADDDDDGMDDDDGGCIGGSGFKIDQSALLLSGMETTGSWMVPALLAVLGVGIFVARKL